MSGPAGRVTLRALVADLIVSASLVVPAAELRWAAVRASGPGGQNVNKVSTKVELRFDIAACSVLSEAVKARLLLAASHRLDRAGSVVLTSDETRSQSQNLELVRARLAELIRASLTAPKTRRATRPSRGSVRRRLDSKAKNKAKKASRSWQGD